MCVTISLSGVIAIVALALMCAQWAARFARYDDAVLSLVTSFSNSFLGTRFADLDLSDRAAIQTVLAGQNDMAVKMMSRLVLPHDITISVVNVTTRDGATLAVRRYSPPRRASDSSKRAAVVYYHPGGWVLMCGRDSLAIADHELIRVATELKADVFSVDYRCAPDHRFPIASHDAIDAFCAISARADEFQIDASKIAVAGSSAGANLALVTALSFDSTYASQWQSSSVCRRGTRAPKLIIANVAVCDLTFSDASVLNENVIGVLNFRTMMWMRLLYAPDGRDTVNPLLSPVLADASALKRMPPTMLVTGGHDILRDGCVRLAAQLTSERTTALNLKNTPHDYLQVPMLYHAETEMFYKTQREFFSKHI
jgi:acetyl esterase